MNEIKSVYPGCKSMKAVWMLCTETMKSERCKASVTMPVQYGAILCPIRSDEFTRALLWRKKNNFHGLKPAIAWPAHMTSMGLLEWLNRFDLIILGNAEAAGQGVYHARSDTRRYRCFRRRVF